LGTNESQIWGCGRPYRDGTPFESGTLANFGHGEATAPGIYLGDPGWIARYGYIPVAFTQMSNVLGTITPAKEIISLAHQAGAITLVDAAQSVPHIPVDVQDLDVDFLAFSAHKMLGPTGIGALFGRKELLDAMPPFLGGGDMIKRVDLRSFQPNSIPHKFEAGTPAIAEAVGFGAAIDYLSQIGMEAIEQHEQRVIAYAMDRLEEIPGVWGESVRAGSTVQRRFGCICAG